MDTLSKNVVGQDSIGSCGLGSPRSVSGVDESIVAPELRAPEAVCVVPPVGKPASGTTAGVRSGYVVGQDRKRAAPPGCLGRWRPASSTQLRRARPRRLRQRRIGGSSNRGGQTPPPSAHSKRQFRGARPGAHTQRSWHGRASSPLSQPRCAGIMGFGDLGRLTQGGTGGRCVGAAVGGTAGSPCRLFSFFSFM